MSAQFSNKMPRSRLAHNPHTLSQNLGPTVTENGKARVPVPFGTMFIRLLHISKFINLTQNTRLYREEIEKRKRRKE